MRALLALDGKGYRSGMPEKNQAIAAGFVEVGRPAVRPVAEALEHPVKEVRETAAYVLLQLGEHARLAVPQLIGAVEKDVGWALNALVDVADRRAIPVLIKVLRGHYRSSEWAAPALVNVGAAAVRPVLEVLEDEEAPDDVARAAAGILSSIGKDARGALPRLKRVAADRSRSPLVRVRTIETVVKLSESSDALSFLRSLPADRKEIEATVARKLMHLGDPDAVRQWAADMPSPSSPRSGGDARFGYSFAVSELMVAGPKASEAVPYLVEILEADGAGQEEAAQALGFIGDLRATPALVELLGRRNWRLNDRAALALARIGPRASAAVPALQRIQSQHWSWRVRETARQAIASIDGSGASPEERQWHMDNRSYGNVRHDPPACHCSGMDRGVQWQGQWWRWTGCEMEPSAALPPGLVEKSELEGRRVVRPAGSGWLVGTNKGEWGGLLAYVNRAGVIEPILHDNVVDIVELDGETLVVTGLAHLGSDRGTIDRIVRDGTGGWTSEYLVELPGAPTCVLVAGDRVLVRTRVGSAAVSSTGDITLLPCRPACTAPACKDADDPCCDPTR